MSRSFSRAIYLAIGTILTDHRVSRFHRALYQRTSGRGVVGDALGVPMILLTTTGCRTGRARTNPLVAVRDRDTWLVVASNGGRDRLPGWAHNLRADGRVSIRDRGRTTSAVGHEARDAERDRVWPIAVAAYPGFAVYADQTSGTVPVFILEPA